MSNYRQIVRRLNRGAAFGLDDVLPIREAIGMGLVLFFRHLRDMHLEASIDTLPTPLLPPSRTRAMSTQDRLDELRKKHFGPSATGRLEEFYPEDGMPDTFYVVETSLDVAEASLIFDRFSLDCESVSDVEQGAIWLALDFI